jgi:hypothetical protein
MGRAVFIDIVLNAIGSYTVLSRWNSTFFNFDHLRVTREKDRIRHLPRKPVW